MPTSLGRREGQMRIARGHRGAGQSGCSQAPLLPHTFCALAAGVTLQTPRGALSVRFLRGGPHLSALR